MSEPFGGLIFGARGAVLSALLRTDARLTGRQVHALISDFHELAAAHEPVVDEILVDGIPLIGTTPG